jgi:hypothetical protein
LGKYRALEILPVPNDHTNDTSENARRKGAARIEVPQAQDVAEAQNTGAQKINQVEAARTNRHSGSAGGDQELSIEIDFGDGRKSSRVNVLTEACASQKADAHQTQEQAKATPQELSQKPVQIGGLKYDPLSVMAMKDQTPEIVTDATNAIADRTAAGVAHKYSEVELLAWKPEDLIPKVKVDQRIKDSLSGFIYRDKEDEQMDYAACDKAYKAFPEFSRHPNIDKDLIAAIIRNELHFYSALKDAPADGITNLLGSVPLRSSTSLGPAQMQEGHVARLIEKFPQLSDPQLGHITGNKVQALLDKSKAPWFVAAYLAESIKDLEGAKRPVTNASLIQKYNNGGEVHHNNVMKQLDWIKKHHPK